MPLYKELDKERQSSEDDTIDARATELGLCAWESGSAHVAGELKESIGECHDCVNLRIAQFEYGNVWAACNVFRQRLYGDNRVSFCNMYEARGEMSLQEMKQIAYIIDLNEFQSAGFTAKDERFRK